MLNRVTRSLTQSFRDYEINKLLLVHDATVPPFEYVPEVQATHEVEPLFVVVICHAARTLA